MSNHENIVAPMQDSAEGRDAMNRNRVRRSAYELHGFVAACALLVFIWALVLGASPKIHERLHSDANRTEHTCAVTMVSSGQFNHSPHVPLVSAPVPALFLASVPVLDPHWVQSLHLGASVFEHAPPALS
jgi:hypothetical protein